MCKNALFWPSLTPPANPVKFFWSKMACTCVPHIVLHVSCRTRTSGGYFRPSEVRFRAKIPLSSHWFYNVKTQKTQFLQNRAWEMAEIENIHCPICTQPIPSSWQNGLPPALATSVQRGVHPVERKRRIVFGSGLLDRVPQNMGQCHKTLVLRG